MRQAFLVLAFCVCVSAYPKRSYNGGRSYNGRRSYSGGRFYNGGNSYSGGRFYNGGNSYNGERFYNGGNSYNGERFYNGGNSYNGERFYNGGNSYNGERFYNGGKRFYNGGNSYNGERFYNGGNSYNGGRYVDTLHNRRSKRPLTRRDCPLFNFGSDLVTKHDYINTVSTGDIWFPLFTIEIGSASSFAKCRNRFNTPDEDGVFLKEEKCINRESKKCVNFSGTMAITEDECGRVRLQGVNISSDETIYSQDLNQYFWREICDGRNEEGDCENGLFIDLVVRGDRLVDTENGPIADLTSLQWELFAADLKKIYDRDFSDPKLRYKETGEVCEL